MTDYLCPNCGPITPFDHVVENSYGVEYCEVCGKFDCQMTPLAEAYSALKAENEALKNPWQPIDSAPKDGRFIWLADDFSMRIGFWLNGKENESRGTIGGGWFDSAKSENFSGPRGLSFEAKKWAPTPPPPNSADRED